MSVAYREGKNYQLILELARNEKKLLLISVPCRCVVDNR